MKTIRTTAIILCSLIAGVVIGALFVWRSHYQSRRNDCFVGAADALVQLQELRSSNVDAAIKFLETKLAGKLTCLWAFYKDPKQIELDTSQIAAEAPALEENYGISSLQRLQ